MAEHLPKRRLRVAHIITDLDVGGAERMLVRIVGALRDGMDQCVVSLCPLGPIAAELTRLGIPVESLGLRRGRVRVGAVGQAAATLRRFRPDVLQSWLYHADLMATLVWPLVGRPALAWNLRCADMDLGQYSRMTRWVRAGLARLSSVPAVVVSNSESSRRVHQAYGYHPRRWEVIGNGFDTEHYRPRAKARESLHARLVVPLSTSLVGMIARADPAKDHNTLLDAARVVCAQSAEVRFLLVGTGVPTLAEAVRARHLQDRVILEDARDDIAELTAGLDLCVLSSAFGESFPNVLGEAMACGVPCVSTDVGDVHALLDGVGVVVPRRDPAALADAVLRALDWGEAERAERATKARSRIVTRYSLPAIADRYRALYREIADGCVD